MPAKLRLLGSMLLISFVVAAADAPPTPPPDMDLIEFLGTIQTDSASVQDIVDAINTALPPELPEAPPHERK